MPFVYSLQLDLTAYFRLLRDPKPKVVGIGWVVECIEQRQQVDETDFLIDLMHTNVAGTHKACLVFLILDYLSDIVIFQRRRSMLPKLFAEEEPEKDESVDGDRSVDGSVSCEYNFPIFIDHS